MTVVLFVIILAILILSHEFGHFIVAKKSGIRVDEFGLGFPPKVFGWKKGETTYSLNLIPFGGFVKIFGEDPDDESLNGPDRARSLVHQPRYVQAAVMVAGIVFNLILAWLLISAGLMAGLPTPLDAIPAGTVAPPAKLLITEVLPGSPAAQAGLKVGDELVSFPTVAAVQKFTHDNAGKKINFAYRRQGQVATAAVVDEAGTIGIGLDEITLLRLAPPLALLKGLTLTANLAYATALGLVHFIAQAVTGQAALANITGPVGLAGLVGDASNLGWVYLLSFTAFISINLAVINLIPFPALDGGRLLFLLIEKLKGSAIKPKIANTLNLVGFGLLIILMLVVTYHDIARLIH